MGSFAAQAESLWHGMGQAIKPQELAHKLAEETYKDMNVVRHAGSNVFATSKDYASKASAAVSDSAAHLVDRARHIHLPSMPTLASVYLKDAPKLLPSVSEVSKHIHLPNLHLAEAAKRIHLPNLPEAAKSVHLPNMRLPNMLLTDATKYIAESLQSKADCIAPRRGIGPDSPIPQTPGDHDLHMNVDGVDREYRLHLPPQYDGKTKMPVVYFYHCLFSDPQEMAEFTKLSAKADKEGFIAVYPSAQGWLPEQSPVHLRQWRTSSDAETSFARKLMDTTQDCLSIDKKQVYVGGYSNGGMMAQKIAAAMPERVAAMASIKSCQSGDVPVPKEGVPALLINGDKDPLVPYEGRRWWTVLGMPEFKSAKFSRDFWREANGTTQRESESSGKGTIERERYVNPQNNNEVVQYTIKGSGHCCPGASSSNWGPVCKEMDATDVMWKFFKNHHK